MDEDQRTVWCGNLSEKVTEDILYELFLQGGPVQKVSIPKDRDGKQRTYGFVTFKHAISVPYALELFEGTSLFDRTLSMKPRNNITPQLQLGYKNGLRQQEPTPELPDIYQLQNEIIMRDIMNTVPMCGIYTGQNGLMYPNQPNPWSNQEDGRSQRVHPYHRERERNDYKARSDYRDRHSSHRSNDYGRSSDHRNHRRNYHKK